MDTSTSTEPTPEHIIHPYSRFARQDGWRLDDISLSPCGNIAVSGHNYLTYQSFVCVYSTVDNSDSRDKATLLYEKGFEDKDSEWLPWRRISFMETNSTEIVTCLDDEVQVIDYNRDVVLRSRKVNGETTCLFVNESQIFIGLRSSDIVNIYDKDLNRIKSIRLKGIRGYDDCLWDMTAAADRLYVCTNYSRAIVYCKNSGCILTRYDTGNEAYSVTVNVKSARVAVLWYDGWSKRQVAVYSFTDNNCLVVFDVESGVSKIRISDQGRIVTGNEDTGEVKIYDSPQIFTYNNLKVTLSSLFSKYDLEVLVKYFKISNDSQEDDIDDSLGDDIDDSLEFDSDGRRDQKKAARLLTILEKEGLFEDGKFHYLNKAFSHLGSCSTSKFLNLVYFYQQHADRNTAIKAQTSDSNESALKLQLDGFLSDWTACDISLSPSGMVAVSGCSGTMKKTSLDFICNDNSGSWGSWIKARDIDGGSESERLVSFIDEYRLVTCCGNVVQIISCDTNETDIRVSLQSSGCASCIAVRNQDVYIGFQESSIILMLNRDLKEKATITLKEVKNMWPVDLAVTPGKLLICMKNDTFSQVLLFKKKDGQKLVQFRNIDDETQTPLSVAAIEKSDLVGILWSTDVVGTLWSTHGCKPCGHVSLHSLTYGYCLSFVAVSFTVRGFQHRFDGPHGRHFFAKRVRFSTGQVAVMDDRDGVNFFSVKEAFNKKNVATTLSQVLSSKDCKGFKSALEDDREDDGNGSEFNDSEDGGMQHCEKMRRLDDILAILTSKGHLEVKCVNKLRRQFSRHEHSHSTRRFPIKLTDDQVQMLGFGRSAQCKHRSVRNVNISFSSSQMFAMSVSCPERTCNGLIYVYQWNVSSSKQPILRYYRKFESGAFVSFLDDCKAVICYDDVIEIVALTSSNVEVTASHKLRTSPTCMATRDGNVYLGCCSSKIMVLNSNLVLMRIINMKHENHMWPADLAAIPGRLFVCTDGRSSNALSLSEEDGQTMVEYNCITDEEFRGSRVKACSISAIESNDSVGICWREINLETVHIITLHSISKGTCLAVVDNVPVAALKLCGEKTMLTYSEGALQPIHLDQQFVFQHWKTLLALRMSHNEYEKLCKFYNVSEQQIAEKTNEKSGYSVKQSK